MSLATVILAAGYGTRMKSKLPKVLHPVAGQPLVKWSVQVAESVSDLVPVVVVGYGREQVEALLEQRVKYAVQDEMLGTGHAVRQATDALKGRSDRVLVLYADMPLLRGSTLQELATLFDEEQKDDKLAIAMLTIERDDPQGFGRVIRDEEGNVQAVVEEADCTPKQLQIKELNSGIYCFDADWLWENLPKLQISAKGEYYLTDMVALAVEQGRRVITMQTPLEDVYGINTRSHLAVAAKVLRRRIADRHMAAGVTIVDPQSTYIDTTVEIGNDTVILPGCHLQGNTQIGEDCTIGPNSLIVDSVVADNCNVTFSVLEEARMEEGSDIGPFSHLRPGAHLGEGVHMGNFGEVKNSYLGAGTHMGHFSYIGDSDIGTHVNVGAGTITCNFDGKKKNRTKVGDRAFLGSDTLLIAPIEVGERARTGAGSVVTHDVPADRLVYGVPATEPKPKHGTGVAKPSDTDEQDG